MRKSIFQKSIVFLFAILMTTGLLAVPISWTGGGANNLWSNPANWSTGTVPTSADDVTIPAGSGTVRYNYNNRRAKSVHIESGSTLRILAGKRLRIINAGVATGILNEGNLMVWGSLVLNNCTLRGISNLGNVSNWGTIYLYNQSNYGIDNEGNFFNGATGSIVSNNGGSSRVIVSTIGDWTNLGSIRFMAGGTGGGMRIGDGFLNDVSGTITYENGNQGEFFIQGNTAQNSGEIRFINPGTTTYPVYVSSGETFTNGSAGNIILEDLSGYGGITVAGSGTFDNRGAITITSQAGATGIFLTGGRMSNSTGATIDIDGGYSGIHSNGFFENYGTINVSNGIIGMSGYVETVNQNSGVINIEGPSHGIWNYPGGMFTNKGEMNMSNISIYDVFNQGDFYNIDCGFLEGDANINNEGVFENEAWLSYLASGTNHSYTINQILNTGVIIDPYDRFATALDNQEARLIALTSPAANVLYSPALDIANITTSSISDFYTDVDLLDFAGTYDHAANSYLPDNAAVGATILYTKVILNGCIRVVEIRVDGGVSPIANPNPNHFSLAKRTAETTNENPKMKNFPNPTSGIFQISLSNLPQGNFDLQIFNTQGQVVASQTGNALTENTIDFDLSDLPTGIYWSRLVQGGVVLAQERIVVVE